MVPNTTCHHKKAVDKLCAGGERLTHSDFLFCDAAGSVVSQAELLHITQPFGRHPDQHCHHYLIRMRNTWIYVIILVCPTVTFGPSFSSSLRAH